MDAQATCVGHQAVSKVLQSRVHTTQTCADQPICPVILLPREAAEALKTEPEFIQHVCVQAIKLFDEFSTSERLSDFLTLPAYDYLVQCPPKATSKM